MLTSCFNCKVELVFENTSNIMRSEECPKCLASIRSCMMCQFHDTNSYNECREPSADRNTEKEKANFCDYYKIGTGKEYEQTKEDSLSTANSLFQN